VSTLWVSTHYSTVVVFVLLLLFVSWRSLRVGLARFADPLAALVRPLAELGKVRKVT
jgi:hypothetical protein